MNPGRVLRWVKKRKTFLQYRLDNKLYTRQSLDPIRAELSALESLERVYVAHHYKGATPNEQEGATTVEA